MLVIVEFVEEVFLGISKVVKVIGVINFGWIVSILVRGFNKFVLEEVEWLFYDVFCVVRCLVKKR